MPRKSAEEIRHLELGSLDSDFARLNLGQIQQVIDEFQQVLSALADIGDLLGLLAVELPVGVLEQQVRQGEDRIHRRSEFMAHVGEKARFHFVRAPQMPRLFIQLGIQCDYASIGVFQLAIEADQFLLPLVQFLQGASNSWFCCRTSSMGFCGSCFPSCLMTFSNVLPVKSGARGGRIFASRITRSSGTSDLTSH